MAEQAVKIRVTSGYRARGSAYIPEGEYALDDPILQGQSRFLLETGRAVQLDAKGKPVQITVQAGAADRDLAGKPIVVQTGQDQGQLSNTIPPVFAQFPNNASASEVIQPYEINATEPAAVEGSEWKVLGTPGAKTEGEARLESVVTEAAVEEAEAVREQAAKTDGEVFDAVDDFDRLTDEEIADLGKERDVTWAAGASREERIAALREAAKSADPYEGRNLDSLRDEVRDKDLTVYGDDGEAIAVSKAKRAQLIAALEDAK